MSRDGPAAQAVASEPRSLDNLVQIGGMEAA
jgi:hypothetical protein